MGAPTKLVTGTNGEDLNCLELALLYEVQAELLLMDDCRTFAEQMVRLNNQLDLAVHCECSLAGDAVAF